jgi:hypothetical protein
MSEITVREFSAILRQYAKFVKENYEPWKDWHEDDIATYFIRSTREGTVVPIYVGGELVGIYEYWRITSRYLKVLRAMTGEETFPLPEPGDREGEITFFPMTVIAEGWRDKTMLLSRLMQFKLQKENPKLAGVYRWVLKRRRLRYMPFREKKERIKEAS